MYDPDFCSREYNARAAVPDHLQYFSRWDARSRLARSEEKREGRLRGEFAYGASAAEKLDLFLPEQGDAPILVFLHGGYWRGLDKKDFSFIAPPYLDRGMGVAIPNYALLPTVTLDVIVMQTVALLAWLWRAGPRLGFDRKRIVVSGHSAGGHLAAMALAARWTDYAPDLPADLVKGAVLLSGLFDLEPLRHTDFLSDVLRLDANQATNLSPACLPQFIDTPYATAVGERESSEFHRQSQLLRDAWGKTARADLKVEGCHHFSICEAFSDPDTALFSLTQSMIEAA